MYILRSLIPERDRLPQPDLIAGFQRPAADQPITYPKAKKIDHTDEYHGQKVADPYRWLEEDVRKFADVKSWKGRSGLSVESQAKLTGCLRKPATVILFGHPRRLADIPGEGAVYCGWSGDVAMQVAAAQRLAAVGRGQ